MKACLVGHSAAGLLQTSAGGSEGQIAVLARELARRGHAVTFVALDAKEAGCVADRLRVVPAWDADRGVRVVRALTHRYPRLWRTLTSEHADVYYSRGAGFYTPFVVEAARWNHSTSILGLASDRDLHPSAAPYLFAVRGTRLSPIVASAVHRVYRYWTLPRATWIAVQNQQQAEACMAARLPYAPVPNIVPPPLEQPEPGERRGDVVWAGNVVDGRRSKGFEELADLIRRLPEVSFTVAGHLEAAAHERTIEELRRAPNVTLTGTIGHDEMMAVLRSHELVINTSPSEGFSNVMLEGWSLGRPSVTLCVNPDGLLAECWPEHGSDQALGLCAAGDVQRMAAAIRELLAAGDLRRAMGERGREYVCEQHAPDRVCEAFERLVASAPC